MALAVPAPRVLGDLRAAARNGDGPDASSPGRAGRVVRLPTLAPRLPRRRGNCTRWSDVGGAMALEATVNALSPVRCPKLPPNARERLQSGKQEEPQVLDLRLFRSSDGDGTRTRNHRIDSPANCEP